MSGADGVESLAGLGRAQVFRKWSARARIEIFDMDNIPSVLYD